MDYENYKISIIVPVYNVEKYLRQCIESILSQTYKNYEIVLIDDGSQDGSSVICDEYSMKFQNIKVSHIKNSGLSNARNVGIDMSKGEYLMFLDSDDYWDCSDGLENIVQSLNSNSDTDLLIFRYKKYYEKTSAYELSSRDLNESYNYKKYSKNEIINYLLNENAFFASACNKVIRRKFIIENNLKFKVGATSEDIEWCARLMIRAKYLSINNSCFYVYRQRDDSITHTMNVKNIICLKENILQCIDYSNEIQDKNNQFLNLYYNYVSYQYMTFLVCCHFVKDKNIKNELYEMKKYSYLLNYDKNKKVKVFKIINNIFGYKFLYFAIEIYLKLRKR